MQRWLTRAALLAAFTSPALAQFGSADSPLDAANWNALGGGFTFGSANLAPRASASAPHDHGGPGWSTGRPDGHAPIGVMGDHMHSAGEWMVSVRYMNMRMDGMRDGTDSLSSQEVLGQGFMVTPTDMRTDMVMFGGMFAPTDDWTLMAMVPYIRKEMDHLTGGGGRFRTETEGLGDVRLSGLYSLADHDGQRVHLNLGLSVPTGSIDEEDDTPAMQDARLPYPMQLGTGTFDLLPGLTYLGQRGDWSWGAQGILRFALESENDEDYRRGNRIDTTAWVARRLGDWSVSGRLAHSHWENIRGSDPLLNPNMVPTANPDLQGGDRLDALVGLNWQPGGGGHRFAVEFGVPLVQDLDGPQMEVANVLTFGWQYAF